MLCIQRFGVDNVGGRDGGDERVFIKALRLQLPIDEGQRRWRD